MNLNNNKPIESPIRSNSALVMFKKWALSPLGSKGGLADEFTAPPPFASPYSTMHFARNRIGFISLVRLPFSHWITIT